MKFILESLKIRNFKGIRKQDINFSPVSTDICGENATGKSTIADAFTWLLFEKDSKGRSQFEIKTLENGEALHGLNHSVEGIFKIDGRQLKLKKIYKEVWTKRRGENQETFTGHEIERFINDIPVKKSEYDKKIGQLVDEKIFQLLTDPLYFSQQLGWKERRATLFALTGEEITKESVFEANPNLKLIEEDLEDKTIEELKKALSYQRRELNKKRENIPVRIETLNSTIKDVDKEVIDIRIRMIKGSIEKIEEEMLDATKLGEKQLKKQDELYKLKSRQKEIEYEIQSSIKDPDEDVKKQIIELRNKLRELEIEEKGERRAVATLESSIERGNRTLEKLRKDYKNEAERELVIDENIKVCPTCQRPFPAEEVESKTAEIEENFKSNQVKELKRLREEGQSMAKEVNGYKEELIQIKDKLYKIESESEALRKDIKDRESMIGTRPKPDIKDLLEENKDYQDTRTKIESLEIEVRNRDHAATINQLKKKKAQLELELKEMEKMLHQDETNKETQEKIKILMEEEKKLSQQINDIEQKEHIADEFIVTRAELIERNINEKFEKVSFRLFKKQVNGALDETCDVLVDGVPFDNANTAGQVNAGLDVINSLCRHYNIYTPIFIDNRESVNELIATDSQLINLKVTKHKSLRVEVEG